MSSADDGLGEARDFETLLRTCEQLLINLRASHACELELAAASALATAGARPTADCLVEARDDQQLGEARWYTDEDEVDCEQHQKLQESSQLLRKHSAWRQSCDFSLDAKELHMAVAECGPSIDAIVDQLEDSTTLSGRFGVNSNNLTLDAETLRMHFHASVRRSKSPDVRQYGLKSMWRSFDNGDDNSERQSTPKRLISSKSKILQDTLPYSMEQQSWMVWLQSTLLPSVCCFGTRRGFVVSPDAPARLCWDILGTLLIGWDVMTIPLQAFELPDTPFLFGMSWFVTVFWSIDIFLCFCVGYYHKGNLVMDAKSIAKNYLKSWFAIDCIVVGGDWVTKLADGMLDIGGLGRVTRIVRAIRVLRLLRLLKLKKLLADLQEHIYTEYSFILVLVFKQLLFILLMNHCVACTWYWIGNRPEFDGWVGVSIGWDASIEYRYGTSLHWSLTQFMPGSMEVNPRTTAERYFAILVLLMGMIGFSSFVSNITTSMTSLRNLTSEDGKQLWLLRRFMQQEGVPKTLGSRICSFLDYTANEKRNRVQASDIRILTMLSEPLRDELNYQLRVKHLENHPIFEELCSDMPVLMHRLCRTALQTHSLAAKDVLFYCGDEAHHMYFCIHGVLEYEFTPVSDGPPVLHRVEHGDWICEAALWTNWRHVGDLRAGPGDTSGSELLSVNADGFCQMVGKNANAWSIASTYASRFVAELNLADDKICDTFMTARFLMESEEVANSDSYQSIMRRTRSKDRRAAR